MRSPWLAGLVVFVLALSVRLAYVEEHARVLDLDVSRLTQTDNHVFAEWARVIAAGDWLCREQPHAYHHWTRLVAPEGRWLEWYGGEQTFHQAPLYPYLVASVFAFIGDEHLNVARAQALLSSLACWLTFLLAYRLVNLRAGLIAGLLMSFCGGFIFYDAFILRDGPMAFFVALLAVALEWAARRDRPLPWFLAGTCLGLFSLAKETGPALLAITLVCLAWQFRRQPARGLLRVAPLLLGFGLLLAPAVLRNLEVGAPPLKLSTRGPEVLITGNARGQDGVGWDPPAKLMREILSESNFSMGRAFLLTLETHRAEPWGWVDLMAHKTSALFNDYEIPNNVNFYLHRAHLSSLRFGVVGWGLLTPAAVLGLLVGLRRRRKYRVPYLMFGAITASVVLLYILARFRLQLLPLMAFFAAVGIDGMISSWRAGRRVRVAAGVAVFLIVAIWAAPSESDPYNDENKNMSIMFQLAKVGKYERALEFYDAQKAILDGDQLNQYAERLAKVDAAFEIFRELDHLDENSAAYHLHLARAFTEIVPVTKRAELTEFHSLAQEHYRTALAMSPEIRGANHGLARLEAYMATHATRGGANGPLGPVITLLRRELELHPDHGESHRDLGLLYRGTDRSAERWHIAMTHLLTAQTLGVEDGELLAAIAVISCAEEMRTATPVRVLDQAQPAFDSERAVAAAERALQLSPQNPRVLYDVADVFYVQLRFDESVALLERLAELQPWRQDVPGRIESFRKFQARRMSEDAPDAEPELEEESP